jgi:hypothetical protein
LLADMIDESHLASFRASNFRRWVAQVFSRRERFVP